MKEDKFCLSKSVAFIAVVAFILVGVVVFTNYMNSQKVGGTPKASGGTCSSTYSGYCTTEACNVFETRVQAEGDVRAFKAGPDVCGTGTNCCVPVYPTSVPVAAGAMTCRDQGGDWFNKTCANLSTDTNMVYSDPPAAVSDPVGGLTCCVLGNWPAPSPGQKSCVDQGGQWFPKNTYTNCSDIGGYEDVTPAGGAFLEGKAWTPTYNCCKLTTPTAPTAGPTLPAGSKTCKDLGGDWYAQDCPGLSGSYVVVTAPGTTVIADASFYSGKFCCKPEVKSPTATCGYFTGETCFKTGTGGYANCAAVETALGGGWKAAPVARTSCGANKICCTTN